MTASSRAKITVRGAVQGVGFRPFVHRLATELGLRGYVLNSSRGVVIEVEGEHARTFVGRLDKEKPPLAILQSIETDYLDPIGHETFEMRPSDGTGAKTALILPDIATCGDCLRDVFDPANRRFRYPFTNCTNCGPRFSIVEALPYDRANTSMKNFAMCAECDREYHDPEDRRFHAQPNACPKCGPQLALQDSLDGALARGDAALCRAADAIRDGKIVALKGLGGFQLLVDARNAEAVVRLRARKHREEKPFALMFPSLESIRHCCEISTAEERLLATPAAPIVILKRLGPVAGPIAPGNPNLGVMLPYTPLHHLLMRELQFPIVATSGNLSDEPICIDNDEARQRLAGIADLLLTHNRLIVRHVDDSIVRVIAGREVMLRRARGYAPLPVMLREEAPTTLALGAHLKNSVALSVGRNVFVSQHIGDLSTQEAHEAFRRTAADLPRLYDAPPAIVAHDLHPEYLSTKYAQELAPHARLVPVQHHFAHVLACMAENEIDPPVLGICWDGTGYGTDQTIWGGEFLLVRQTGFERVAHLRTFALPGGDAAVKEPRRSALGLLHEIFGDALWNKSIVREMISDSERPTLRAMLEKGINTPRTSSAGRLFDGVAAILGLRLRSSFEGQAAMELEFAASPDVSAASSFLITDTSPLLIDWEPMIVEMMDDRVSVAERAAKFHQGLTRSMVAIAERIGEPKVALSGGCFQNRRLLEQTIDALRAAGFVPYWHQHVPPNDGGISLGQIVASAFT